MDSDFLEAERRTEEAYEHYARDGSFDRWGEASVGSRQLRRERVFLLGR